MKGPAMVLAAALALLSGTCWAEGFDWPRWRGPDGNGVSKETDWDPGALADGAKVLWIANIGAGYSSVVIKDGRLYTAGTFEGEPALSCLDASSGDTVWMRPYKDYCPAQSTPAVDDERVYALGGGGLLLCLRASNGEVLWQKDLTRDFGARRPHQFWASSPVVDGDLLLVNGNTVLLGLDKKSGAELWRVKDEVPEKSWGSYATPVTCDLEGRRVVVLLGPSRLIAVDAGTGRVLWSFAHGDEMQPVADPIVTGGAVFYAVGKSCGVLLLSGDGSAALWKSSAMTTWLPGPVPVGGHLYGTTLPPEFSASAWMTVEAEPLPLRCVEWDTGKIAWENPMKYVSATAAGSVLFLLELNGTLHIAEASPLAYHELASVDVLQGAKRPRTFATPPVLCNGRIYCRNFAGDLVCIDARKR